MGYFAPSGFLEVGLIVGLGLLLAVPCGRYMARVFLGRPTALDPLFVPLERGVYRLLGVNARRSMGWREYLVALLFVNLGGWIVTYVLLTFQGGLPFNALGAPDMDWTLAFHTSSAFLTNTDYQHYVGESQVSLLAGLLGLQVLMFLSAATGLSVAASMIRGFVRKDGTIGNFWVDLTRSMVWILLPLSVVGGGLLILAGVPQTLHQVVVVHPIWGSRVVVPVGPLGSWDSIEWLGSNGGGYFGANGGHPLQNPTGVTNLLAIVLMMLIPFSTPIMFGHMIRRPGEGYSLFAVVTMIFLAAVVLFLFFESSNTFLAGLNLSQNNGYLVGAESRFTLPESGLFQVTSIYDNVGSTSLSLGSLTPGAQMVLLWGMFLQLAPGGVGTGFGTLILTVLLAVFVAGLMVGRTPEYLGKKLNRENMKWSVIAILAHPFAILVPLGITYVVGLGTAAGGTVPHGFTVLLYEFTSESANNGSGMGPISDGTPYFNLLGAGIMLFGRFFPILAMLASAGAISRQSPIPPGLGTLKTDSPTFTFYLVAFILIVTGLLFLPVLALGPFAQGGL